MRRSPLRKGESVTVVFELYGPARLRAGHAEITVNALTVGEALCSLAVACPPLAGPVIQDGHLTRDYKLSLNGEEAPVIDGYTGDQRFFLGWAQVWQRRYRDDELRRRLLTDSHSPSEYRTNGIVSNMPEFVEAFDVQPGDGMYKAPDERVKIW